MLMTGAEPPSLRSLRRRAIIAYLSPVTSAACGGCRVYALPTARMRRVWAQYTLYFGAEGLGSMFWADLIAGRAPESKIWPRRG